MPLQHIQNNDKTKLVHDLQQCNFPPDIFRLWLDQCQDMKATDIKD